MYNVVSKETLRNARRQGTHESQVPFVLNGKVEHVTKKIVNGEMELHQLSRPMGEMITSGGLDQFRDLLRKVVLDVELGRELQPLVYGPIYERIEDANFPRVIDAKWALQGVVVFTEHIEGQEVRFGRLDAVQGPTARILTFAAGFEYTKEILDFNETFRPEMLNRALGEAHNALLNDIHLRPIITHSYTGANLTTWIAPPAGNPAWVGIRNTIVEAQKAATRAKRPGTVLLANPVMRAEIELAMTGGHNIGGTVFPAIGGIQQVIYYDSDAHHGYTGVAENRAYLIRPRRGFKELVKQDLRVEAQQGDLSRLVQEQIIAYAYRGVYAALTENVQQINLA
ncbi:MAG: hypothetical protein DDT20_01793 [Firmicutes bacterium]|nr:hypothetical protein [Bacillota bacterium]